jgi:hypothetical protein
VRSTPLCALHRILQMMLKKTKGLTWPLLLFALATTLVYMGGLAALQHRCSYIPSVANAAGSGIFGRSAFGECALCHSNGCNAQHSYPHHCAAAVQHTRLLLYSTHPFF